MSKDSGFTRSLIESNEIFTEVAKALQSQISKVSQRLEGLENDLQLARSKLKSKDLEILRLNEIIKTYELDKNNLKPESNENFSKELIQAVEEIKSISQNFKSLSLQSPNNTKSSDLSSKVNDEFEEVEVEDEEFNSLVEELELKKLEIQALQQDKDDLKEQEQMLKSKIILLEKNLESLTESKISTALRDLQTKFADVVANNSSLETKIAELEEQLLERENIDNLANEDEEDEKEFITSLQTEISKYVKENISLHEKIAETEEFERQISHQNAEIVNLNKKLSDLEKTKKELQNKLISFSSDMQGLHNRNRILEKELEDSLNKNLEFEREINSLSQQISEKEQEILSFKLHSNQLDEEVNDLSAFEENSIDFSKSDSENVSNEDDLLLKISEMEMEEANWQDEKKVLLETIESLHSQLKFSPDTESIDDSVVKKEAIIKSLRNEILELSQDLDDADSELKEIQIENSALKEKVFELESKPETIPNSSESMASDSEDDKTELIFELKEKESVIEEYETRLQTQEKKISHLENLMNQERELKEKYEHFYKNLKEKENQEKPKSETQDSEARKQLRQILNSMNQSSNALDLEDVDDTENQGQRSKSDDLGKALENANLYVSLIDKFLKPHVQITQLLKQGTWEINSLGDLVGIDKKNLMSILRELSEKKILRYDDSKVWLLTTD